MMEPLPQDVRDLLARHLAGMEHVEVLLAVAGDEARSWNAEEIAAVTHTPVASVTARLEELSAAGFVSSTPSAGRDCYKYSPRTEEMRNAVTSLDEMYRTKPVTLIKAIYERPVSAVQSFADAFRFRKTEP